MKEVTKKTALNAANLKQALWETLQGVKTKKINPTVANSVASQSRELMRVVNTELNYHKARGTKPETLLLG